MKRLILAPLLMTLLLTSCSGKRFNSQYEANKACEEWESQGFIYKEERRTAGGKIYQTLHFSRKCILDSTNQYVGEENISVKKGDSFKYRQEPKYKYKYKNFYFK